jgi:hypothetical protein
MAAMEPRARPDNCSSDLEGVFSGARAQALAEGALVDVTERAQEVGFTLPVAVSAALWADIQAIPRAYRGVQDTEGRLREVLRAGCAAARRSEGRFPTLLYNLTMPVGNHVKYTVKMLCGTGDAGESVITLMRLQEEPGL